MTIGRLSIRIVHAGAWLALLARPQAAELPGARIDAFFERHCYSCHDQTEQKGGLDLEALTRNPSDPESLRRWVRVFDRVAEAEMPPKKKPRPAADELKDFLATLRGPLVENDRAQREVVHRRLNRAEYENTVRDLFQVRAEVA